MATGAKFWLLRFGELAIKSRPVRQHFQRTLERSLEDLAIQANIDLMLEKSGTHSVAVSHSEAEVVEDVLRHCFGLVAADPARPCEADPEAIAELALKHDPRAGEKRTFGVRTKRSGPKGKYSSQEFSGSVGHFMLQKDDGLSVNLSNPDYPVVVNLTNSKSWLLGERVRGPGGLPHGVQGKVLARISNERDMLGAWQLMRRGCRIIPQDGSNSELLEILAKWDPTVINAEKAHKANSGPGRNRAGLWGAIGMNFAEVVAANPPIEGRKHTPLSNLDPLCAWTELELTALGKHVRSPSSFENPSADGETLMAWIA